MDLSDYISQMASYNSPSFPLNYNNLYRIWLEANAQNAPQGFNDISNFSQQPYSSYMKPVDIAQYMRAFSPRELFDGSGQKIPIPFDYPTVAVNLDYRNNIENLDKPSLNAFASELGTPMRSLGNSIQGLANDYSQEGLPKNLRRFVPNAVLAHEQEHYNNPQFYTGNKGYFKFGGLSPRIFQREISPMIAEENYWVSKGKNDRELNYLRTLQERFR